MSGQTTTAEAIESGEERSGAWIIYFDLMVLLAVTWLVWRYVKRWKYKCEWKRAHA